MSEDRLILFRKKYKITGGWYHRQSTLPKKVQAIMKHNPDKKYCVRELGIKLGKSKQRIHAVLLDLIREKDTRFKREKVVCELTNNKRTYHYYYDL